MDVRLIDRVSEVKPEAWDALVGEDDPFVEHAFLGLLEDSGTVGGTSGWDPCHVTVWDGTSLVGALPLYLKHHSFGEFIFDWGWADAASRLGLPYYPKLVSMVPVTPVTGRRLLIAPGRDTATVARALTEGCFEAAELFEASSIHLLFLTQEERDRVVDERLRPRLSHQFHWHNEAYASFEEFLGRFRSATRKQVRRERRRVYESGLEIGLVPGAELSTRDWDTLAAFYRSTCAQYGSYPYLTPRFFELAPSRVAHRTIVAMARRQGTPIAASLNFEKGSHLYGRYWGASEEHEFLHFELCYYVLIERAIDRGMRRFEAGAQGSHKLRRGLMPSRIHSAHWLRHPLLLRAVSEFLPREAFAVEQRLEELARHGPFRRE